MPLSLVDAAHSELLIKKSRFIGCIQPVANRAEAQAIVALLWAQHPAATHVCWALLAGGQSAAVDDGEPSGTAGRPMLEVLRHQDVDGVLATVVRYYGGVQLGAGGLVRAYTDAIAQAFRGARKVPIISMQTLACSLPYSLEGMMRRELSAIQGELQSVSHEVRVGFVFTLEKSRVDAFMDRINELSAGAVEWQMSVD